MDNAELVLELTNTSIKKAAGGVIRALASARLIFSAFKSEEFTFTAPIGYIEAEDLSWYLERYYH